MPQRQPRLWTVAGLALLAAVAGCGSDGKPAKSTPTRVESAQPPAKHPSGWKTVLDNDHGFSIAVPPGWSAGGRRGTMLYRSPDHLVAVSLSVDRTSGAFRTSPASFARQTLRALSGYKGKLVPSASHPIAGIPLDGVLVTATGESKDGVRQEVEVAVLRRDHLVNYTAVIAANAGSTPPEEIAAARVMVASLRDLPIG